jgi:hypothetical protein
MRKAQSARRGQSVRWRMVCDAVRERSSVYQVWPQRRIGWQQ